MNIPKGVWKSSEIVCFKLLCRQIIEHDLVLSEKIESANEHYAIQTQYHHEIDDVVENLDDGVDEWGKLFM